MNSDTPPNVSPAQKNFISKVMAGDYGLANTYWWLGVFCGAPLSLVVAIFSDALKMPKAAAVLFLIYVAYIVPVFIGIWNAAGKYTGSSIWSTLARIVVVLGTLKIIGSLASIPMAFIQ